MGMSHLIDHAVVAWGVSSASLKGKNRSRVFARPRQVLGWLAVNDYGFTFSAVARALHRDHTTILHGARKVDELIGLEDMTDDLIAAFREDAPPVPVVTRPKFVSHAMSVPVVTCQFIHHEEAAPLVVPFVSVIDEDAMARRRMAGR